MVVRLFREGSPPNTIVLILAISLLKSSEKLIPLRLFSVIFYHLSYNFGRICFSRLFLGFRPCFYFNCGTICTVPAFPPMDLTFDLSLINAYKSPTQIARVLTEDWFARNMYCPICGGTSICKAELNAPVKDFVCNVCKSQYELKSKKSTKESYNTKTRGSSNS